MASTEASARGRGTAHRGPAEDTTSVYGTMCRLTRQWRVSAQFASRHCAVACRVNNFGKLNVCRCRHNIRVGTLPQNGSLIQVCVFSAIAVLKYSSSVIHTRVNVSVVQILLVGAIGATKKPERANQVSAELVLYLALFCLLHIQGPLGPRFLGVVLLLYITVSVYVRACVCVCDQTLKNNTEVSDGSDVTVADTVPVVQREISTQTPTPVSSFISCFTNTNTRSSFQANLG